LGKPIHGLQEEVEFWKQAGYDYVLLGRNLSLGLFPGVYYGKSLDEGDGRAKMEGRWADEKKGLITNWTEYENYPWPNPAEADYSEFEEIGRLLPEGMGTVAYLGPIFQWTWMLMGFETFAFALAENFELVKNIFGKIGDIRLKLFERILNKNRDIGAVWIADDLAYGEGLMVSPNVLREHVFPWYRKIGKVCAEKGLPLILHSDGNLWIILEELIDIGFIAIHPIEPNGMGADIKKLKEKVGKRLCIMGGIDLDVLIRGTPEDVVRTTKETIREAAPGGGYIAGSSNTIPENVPVENFIAMIETILGHGKYPIDL
jgi:uroporphyrinogen decarboxylase